MNADRRVTIDTRPLAILLLSKLVRPAIFAALIAATLWATSLTPPAGLTVSGWRALIVFADCVFLWVSQMLPLAITGLLAIALPPLFGVLPPKETFALFGNDTVFFILGVFILAAAMMKSGLSTRVALKLLRGAGRSPKKLLLQIMTASMLLSFVMSEHAVAAMMFPIVLELSRALEFAPYGGSYGRLLFLSMAWGCIVGGIATLLGSGRAPLSVGILSEMTGQKISFFQWSLAALPVVILMFAAAYLLLTRYYSIDVASVEKADETLSEKIRQQGKPAPTEWFISLIFGGTIILWLAFGGRFGMAAISLLAVVALFVFKTVSWKDLEEYVNWGVFLMYGGTICLAAVLHKTGGGAWLAHKVIDNVPGGTFGAIMILTAGALLLTEAISNSAVVAILTPVAISLSGALGLDPRTLVLLIALASGLGNALPMSTPAMAIAFSAGYFKMRDVVVPAVLMWGAALVSLLLVGKFWWPLIGIRSF